jgi:hypothetical protein
MMVLIWFGAVGAVIAAPVGDPVANPDTGRVHVDVSMAMSRTAEVDLQCSGDACRVDTHREGFGVELGAALLRGVGVYGLAVRAKDDLKEAHFEGRTQVFGGGLRLALPIQQSIWIATVGEMRFGQSESVQSERLTDPPKGQEHIHTASVLTVFGDPNNGGHMWLGVQGAWKWEHIVEPMGQEGVTVDIALGPRWPVSGVFGATVLSDTVGLPWRTSPRLRASIEGRVGQENGLRVATGMAF